MPQESHGSEDTSTSNGLPLEELIKMPANFAEALAVLVEVIRSDRQLIGSVVIALLLLIVPTLGIIAFVESNERAILISAIWLITIAVAISSFFAASLILKVREAGKTSFTTENQEYLQDQLLHYQNVLVRINNYVKPLKASIDQVTQREQLHSDSKTQLVGQMSSLKNYLDQELQTINQWLSRLASVKEMDLTKAASLREARWNERESAQRDQSLNPAQNPRSYE